MKKPNIKKWALTRHAVERMEEREVPISEVEKIINSPDEVISQGQKLIFAKNIYNRKDNMLAAVIVEKGKEELWLVITIMTNFQKF